MKNFLVSEDSVLLEPFYKPKEWTTYIFPIKNENHNTQLEQLSELYNFPQELVDLYKYYNNNSYEYSTNVFGTTFMSTDKIYRLSEYYKSQNIFDCIDIGYLDKEKNIEKYECDKDKQMFICKRLVNEFEHIICELNFEG